MVKRKRWPPWEEASLVRWIEERQNLTWDERAEEYSHRYRASRSKGSLRAKYRQLLQDAANRSHIPTLHARLHRPARSTQHSPAVRDMNENSFRINLPSSDLISMGSAMSPSESDDEGRIAEEGVSQGKTDEGSQSVVSLGETTQIDPARRFLLPSSWCAKELALQSSRAQSDPKFHLDTGSKFSVPVARPEHYDVYSLPSVRLCGLLRVYTAYGDANHFQTPTQCYRSRMPMLYTWQDLMRSTS